MRAPRSTHGSHCRAQVLDHIGSGSSRRRRRHFEVLVAEDGCFDRVASSHAVALAESDAEYGRVMPAGDISASLDD